MSIIIIIYSIHGKLCYRCSVESSPVSVCSVINFCNLKEPSSSYLGHNFVPIAFFRRGEGGFLASVPFYEQILLRTTTNRLDHLFDPTCTSGVWILFLLISAALGQFFEFQKQFTRFRKTPSFNAKNLFWLISFDPFLSRQIALDILGSELPKNLIKIRSRKKKNFLDFLCDQFWS